MIEIISNSKDILEQWLEKYVYFALTENIEINFNIDGNEGIVILTDKGFVIEKNGIEYYLSEITDIDATLIVRLLPEIMDKINENVNRK